MKKIIGILVVLTMFVSSYQLDAKPRVSKNKGVVSKVVTATTYGFGWQIGKEGAKVVINKGKEIAKDPKTKQKVKELKDKAKNLINKEKK